VLLAFVSHYNLARPHQGLGQRPPDWPASVIAMPAGQVERRDRLGGLLREYSRAA
jgi:putative transposase